MKRTGILVLLIALFGCANNEKFIKEGVPVAPKEVYQKPIQTESSAFKKGKLQLRVQGFKNIKETSYPFFCCGEGDSMFFSTGFTAETPEGEVVKGCMCSGMMKGVTVRFE